MLGNRPRAAMPTPLLTPLLLLPVLAAPQDGPAFEDPLLRAPRPARTLQDFEPMLGQWVGQGVAFDKEDGEPMQWTATLLVERVLDGHGVRQDMVVDLGEVLPGGFRSTTFYAHDPQAGHLVAVSCDNRKGVARSVAAWSDNVLLTATMGENGGQLAIERSTFTFAEGKAHYEILHMQDTHAGYVMADGHFRPFTGERSKVEDASVTQNSPETELSKLARSLGSMRLEGTVVPQSGQAPIPMSAIERSELFAGGRGMITEVTGEPEPGFPGYQEIRMVSWNTLRKSYDILWMDNQGLSGAMQGWLHEGALVVVDSGTFQGAPYAQRTTTFLGPKGPTVVTSDRLWGVGPGRRVFEGRYKPLK
jgi:hypothetical protein